MVNICKLTKKNHLTRILLNTVRKLFVNFYFLSVFLCFIGSLSTYAQSLLFISNTDSTSHTFKTYESLTDSTSILECLQNHGYWNTVIDSFSLSESTTTVFGQLNHRYSLKGISYSTPIDRSLQQKIKTKETVFDINSIILEYFTNKGYLFTNITWAVDTVIEHSWYGQLDIQPGDIQLLDSVIVKSEPILKQKKWNNILFPKQNIASPKLEQEADTKLKTLSFIELNKPSKLLITDKKNLLFVFPKKKKVNHANGILAFSNDDNESSSGFTGNFTLHLENILKSAEIFDIRWKAGNGNQDFKWQNSFRYIYHSLGIENQIHIYKQDSTFTKTQLSFGLRIDSKPQSVWSIHYQFEQSAVDNPTISRINYTKNLLHISWLNSNLESNYFDASGHKVHINATVGNRKTDIDTEAEYQIYGTLLKLVPLSKTLRFVGEVQHKQLIQNTLLENNAYNFGGFENMKGFIENRFLTTRYTLLTPTLRFSQQNKYVAELFYQHAFIRSTEEKNERLQSFGLQFILPVKSGWFNFGVSSGRVYPEAFNFSQALIHFGVKNNL